MRWLRFILSHSIFISVCAIALVFQTGVLLHITIPVPLYSFTFFATLCSYNFYWLLSSWALTKQHPAVFIRSHVTNIILFTVAGIGLLISLYHLANILSAVATALLLTILYAIPLMPFKFLRFTRKAGVLKTVVLAFTWTYVTVYLPYATAAKVDSSQLLMLFNNRFLFMLMLCIIFDARDEQVDKLRGLRSLATDVKPRILGYMMIAIFAAYIINGIVFRIYFKELSQLVAFLVSGIATATVYFLSLKKQGYYFYYFVVDGLMLLSAVLTGLATI